MKKWEKLPTYGKASLRRGSLLKFSAGYPFEAEVVMMICESPERSLTPCLLTITGQKAGINCYVSLPTESSTADAFLSVDWLIENWAKWVWPIGSAESVWVREPLSADEV